MESTRRGTEPRPPIPAAPEENSTSQEPSGPPPTPARDLLTQALRRNARALAASFTLLSLWQLSEAMVSVVGGGLFNHALAGGSVGALLIWGGLLILMFTRSMCTCRYGVLSAYRVDRVEANRLRAAIAHHILGPRGAHTERLPGVALSLANGNADDGGTLSRTVSITFASAVSVRSS